MKTKTIFPQINSRPAKLLVAGIATLLLGSVSARADLLAISLQSPISVNAGTSGNSFDVLLKNLSGPAVSIAAFTFEISTMSTDITFTAANTATVVDPYVFSGNSLFGPNITVTNTGQDLSASDLYSVIGSNATLGTGGTIGLGHILFGVSSTAPSETVAVKLTAFPATSLSDDLLNNIPVGTLTGGQISIHGTASVPEPSSLMLLLTAVPLIWGGRRRSRQRRYHAVQG